MCLYRSDEKRAEGIWRQFVDEFKRVFLDELIGVLIDEMKSWEVSIYRRVNIQIRKVGLKMSWDENFYRRTGRKFL